MIYLIYNILFTFLLIFVAPYFLFRSLIHERFRREWIQRMGFFPNLNLKRTIWFHAASVGEVLCTIPLLKKIKKEFPNCSIVFTTMTRTGNETAKTHIPEADRVLFLPVDHPFFLRRALHRIQPCLLLITETELWPNLLRSCGKRGIPTVLFNGRISEKSLRRYLSFKFFFKGCLNYLSLFMMQTEEDRTRMVEMGAAPDKGRVAGNIKFDLTFSTLNQQKLDDVAHFLGLREKRNILIAGSTHAGEEEILLTLFKDLRKLDPSLVCILAPRHLNRLEEVEKIFKKESISWKRKTSVTVEEGREIPEVILLDTMGELMGLYSLGTLIFVGGSLVPVGGHNPLEPLFFKKCVLFGPYMFHFLEISQRLIKEGGALQVKDKEDLMLQMKRLLLDEAARNEIGQKGYRFLQQHQGATERMFEEIRPLLISQSCSPIVE
jgi:3-deoxy-D-manno-octulosonic-acid transferase